MLGKINFITFKEMQIFLDGKKCEEWPLASYTDALMFRSPVAHSTRTKRENVCCNLKLLITNSKLNFIYA